MINPELNNWWSHKRLTNLKFKETSLIGAGISMQVLSNAINESGFVWFSIVYGDFNDNLILVAMDNQTANKFSKIKYDKQEKQRVFVGVFVGSGVLVDVTLSFTNLNSLYRFDFSSTNLCEPSTPEFLAWKDSVDNWLGTDIICKAVFLPMINK